MSSSNEADRIAQFQDLTGAPEHQARFFLESANWDFDTAATAFYENDEPGTAFRGPTVEDEDDDDDNDDSWQPEMSTPPVSSARGTAPPPSRVATLGDLNRSASDDDDEGKQNFFAGGEKSGISIQGPEQSSRSDDASAILSRAVHAPPPSEQTTPHHFTGTGYTLGSESQPSQPVPTEMQPGQRRTAQRRLRLWRNGFSIDDGPLYRWNDPQTTELVREIRQGRLPRDIAGVGRGEEVELAVEKRENEDYTPTPTALGGHGGGRTFVGQGNRLGSAIPGEPVIPAAPAPVVNTPVDTKPPQPTPNINPALPQTTIQLRLVDGTRLVTQFNLSSTLDDLYTFVGQARPTQGREFVLQTIFPTRVLEKSNKTIEEEGLKAGTVVMRWKA